MKRAIHFGDGSGQVVVLTAVVLAALMGFLALAIDVGMLLYEQRELQTAADGAALAGAIEYATCNGTAHCSAMTAAARQAGIENGITVPSADVVTQCPGSLPSANLVMTVNNGPCALGTNDPNHGNADFVEVVMTEKANTFFAAVGGTSLVTLTARSESGETGTGITASSPGNACFYMHGLTMNGSSDLNMACGIQDSGSFGADSDAAATTTSFTFSGGVAFNNCGTANQNTWTGGNCTWTGGVPTPGSSVADPLSSLTAPTQPGTSTTAGNTTPSNGATMQPGYYPNGFTLNSNVGVTLAAGVYYLNSSIIVNSGSTLAGTGVTLYFNSGTLQANSAATIQLSAPTSGATGGMVIWEASGNSTGMTIDATSTSYFQGAIYFPNSSADLTLNSASNVTVNGSAQYTIIDVGGQVIVDANNIFKAGNNYTNLPSGFPIGGSAGTSSSTAVLSE